MEKVICMEIGQLLTRACEVEFHNDKINVVKAICFDTPINTVHDGFIKVTDELAKEIKSQLKMNRMCAEKIYYAVTSTSFFFRPVETHDADDNVLQKKLESMKVDIFPECDSRWRNTKPDEYAIKFFKTNVFVRNDQTTARLEVFAIPKKLITAYERLSLILGIEFGGVVDSSYSIINACYNLFKYKTCILVIVDEHVLRAHLVRDGKLIAISEIDDCSLEFIIQDFVNSSLHVFPQTPADAMYLLSDIELLNRVARLETEKELIEKITTHANDFCANIDSWLGFFCDRHGVKVNNVYFTGPLADIKGMPDYVSKKLNVPFIQLGDALINKINIPDSELSIVESIISCVYAFNNDVNFVTQKHCVLNNISRFIIDK